MITLFVFAASLIGQGLGYGSLTPIHPMLLLSLKNFKISNLKVFCREQKPLVFMALYSALSLLWATSVRIGVRELALIIIGEAIVFFVVYSDVSSKQLFKVLKIVMAANFFICVGEAFDIFRYPFSMYSTLAPAFARTFVTTGESIPTGFYYNPNNNALFILMFSPIMLTLLKRSWGMLYLLLASFVIFMATSKLILVAWIGFLFIIFFGLLIRKFGLTKSLICSLCVIGIVLYLINDSSVPRITEYRKRIPTIATFLKEAPVHLYSRLKGEDVKIEYLELDRSLHERLLLIDGLAKVLRDHWIWGVGGGSLEPITHTQQNVTLSLRMPHFYFLEIFAKYGIIFLGVYLYWLGRILKRVTSINKLYGLSLLLFLVFNPVMSSAMYFLPKW